MSRPGERSTALEPEFSEPAPAWPPLPEIAGYLLERQIGAGGMGVVYRAWEPGLARAVALKLIAPARAGSPRARELFIRESLVAAGLEHPHVVPIYRAGDHDGQLFLAMRYVEGDSLAALIARRRHLPPAQAARIVLQVAGALDAAHAGGMVHRDVKPANVLIAGGEGEEHAYLTDFGLSALAGPPSGGRGWAGTLAYLAPEQIRRRPVDARTDVYALGCLLYHALTGRPPFVGARDEVLVAHLTEPPPAPSAACPWLPARLDAVVDRALAKRPQDRHESAGQLARDARAALDDAFLAHAPAERGRAERLAGALHAEGLETWFAPLRRSPDGDLAHEWVEGLRGSRALVVLVGAEGLGEWARETLVAADRLAEGEGLRRIACLLPGAPEAYDARLAFLTGFSFVDLRDEPVGRATLQELARTARGEPATRMLAASPGVCPYRGLEAFEAEHTELFVGREEEVARAAERLRAARFVALLGSSGSGKSSLLRAGVLPALAAGPLPAGASAAQALLTPGAQPLRSLAWALQRVGVDLDTTRLLEDDCALDDAAERADGGRTPIVVAVDQLEEAFTLCADRGERLAFLRALRHAAAVPAGRVAVAVAMRADVYGRLAEEPGFAGLVERSQLLVGPLPPDRLVRAIEEPAARVGLTLEEGLCKRIVADVAERPGALPLLSYLLFELWRRRRGSTLTNEAYAAAGGVEGALEGRASSLYRALPADAQVRCRRVLLRLVQPGDAGEDSRRRADLAELAAAAGGDEHLAPLLEALSAARLVSVGGDGAVGEAPYVEFAHEALIRAWPELRDWIDQERGNLLLERRLGEAAAEWERSGRDDGALYRGARLAAMEGHHEKRLSAREQAFLAASRERAARERLVRRRRRRFLVAGLASGLAVVSAVAGIALWQRDVAASERDAARSRQLATTAQAQLANDPELSLLLALRAYQASPTVQAEQALRQASHDSALRMVVPLRGAHSALISIPVFQSSRKLVLFGADRDRTARIVDLPSGTTREVRIGGRGFLTGGALSDDGRRLIVLRKRIGEPLPHAGPGSAVTEWDTATGRFIRSLPAGEAAASSNGRVLALDDGAAGRLRIWDWRINRLVREIAIPPRADYAPPAVFSGDGRKLARCGSDGLIRVWSAAVPTAPVLAGRCGEATRLALDAQGSRLAVLADDGTIRLRSLTAPATDAHVLNHPDRFASVAIAADGRVVAGAEDGTVTLWDPASGASATLRGHRGAVLAVAVSPDSQQAVTTGNDGSVFVWSLRATLPRILTADSRGSAAAALSPRGDLLAAGGVSGHIGVWDLRRAGDAPLRVLPAAGGAVQSLAVDAAGARVVGSTSDGMVRDWDWRAANALETRWDDRRLGHADRDHPLALSPDGRLVAVGGTYPTWVLQADGRRRRLPPNVHGQYSTAASLDFTSDGSRLVTGEQDGRIVVWPLDRPDPPEVLIVASGAGRLVQAVEGVDASPDGGLVAGAYIDGTLRIWDLAAARMLTALSGHASAATSVRFSPDGRLLVSGGQDGTVRVWDWRRGVQLLVLTGHRGAASNAFFTPDGRQVVSAGADGTVRIWDCDVCGPMPDVVALAQRDAVRSLTDEERRAFL